MLAKFLPIVRRAVWSDVDGAGEAQFDPNIVFVCPGIRSRASIARWTRPVLHAGAVSALRRGDVGVHGNVGAQFGRVSRDSWRSLMRFVQ